MVRSPPTIPSRSVHTCSSRIMRDRHSARSAPAAMSVITGSPGLKQVPGQGTSAIDRTAKRSSDLIFLGNDFRSNQPPGCVQNPFRDHARRCEHRRGPAARLAWCARLAGVPVLGKQRSARGQLVNLERRRVAGIDLDGPGNPVAQDEVDAEPAGKAEGERQGIAQRFKPGGQRLGRWAGPDAPQVSERRARDADQLPGDADQTRRCDRSPMKRAEKLGPSIRSWK